MKKVFYQRGPDGTFSEFHVTPVDDQWQPIPGQDWALIDAVHGAGWFEVVSVRPIYRASTAHTEVAKGLRGESNLVYLDHMEVFLRDKPIEDQVQMAANRYRRANMP